jgi:hypothetical protein
LSDAEVFEAMITARAALRRARESGLPGQVAEAHAALRRAQAAVEPLVRRKSRDFAGHRIYVDRLGEVHATPLPRKSFDCGPRRVKGGLS